MLHFAFVSPALERRFVVKACIAFASGRSLREIFSDWLTKRARLREFGVATPDILVAGPATVTEEYIPYTLQEAFEITNSRIELVSNIGTTAGKIVRAGFLVLSMHDWRSRGDDVVVIDFGQDLGPMRGGDFGETSLLSEVLDRLDGWHVNLSSEEVRRIGRCYEAALNGS